MDATHGGIHVSSLSYWFFSETLTSNVQLRYVSHAGVHQHRALLANAPTRECDIVLQMRVTSTLMIWELGTADGVCITMRV